MVGNAKIAVEEPRRRFLVVDDDCDFANGLRNFLVAEGYDASVQFSAEQAQAAIEHIAPQVALLDVRLGQASGIDLIGMLKHKWPDLLCVIMTAYGDTDTAVKSLRQGAFYYLRKPFHTEELLFALEHCFETLRLRAEKRKADEALRESEDRLRQAARLAGLGHWVRNTVEDRCLYCSEENARIHGMSVEDYMTKASAIEGEFAMVHPDDRQEIKALFLALRNGREFDKEYRLLTPAGRMRYVREVAKPVFDADGRVVQEFGTIQDITEQKQIEEQLRQAQKMEAVGQLTGGVAHDFNNLLAVVTGNAELLSLQLGEEDSKVQAVLRAADRGAALTQQLLAFSRRQALQPRVLDLNILVQDMREMLSRSLGETIEIRTALDEGLWYALADPGQVENALLNLAINARDAMPDGGSLEIETGNARLDDACVENHPEMAPGDYIVLAVTDSGSGMASNVVEHAFEPFFTTKDVGQGAGLGLSMVYGFAKQSGGHATIYSELGHGTTVKLYLPRAKAQAEAAGPAEEDVPRGRGETVLLVEDDADVRQLAERLLEDLGYRMFTAKDARTALDILDRIRQPDLLLSDVVLPGGLSGTDLAKRVLVRYPGLKLVFMSGYPADAAKRNGFLGSDRFLLSKPFSRLQLAKALRKALGRGPCE